MCFAMAVEAGWCYWEAVISKGGRVPHLVRDSVTGLGGLNLALFLVGMKLLSRLNMAIISVFLLHYLTFFAIPPLYGPVYDG